MKDDSSKWKEHKTDDEAPCSLGLSISLPLHKAYSYPISFTILSFISKLVDSFLIFSIFVTIKVWTTNYTVFAATFVLRHIHLTVNEVAIFEDRSECLHESHHDHEYDVTNLKKREKEFAVGSQNNSYEPLYLHKKSCHPWHNKKAIPYGQALRFRRICSEDRQFQERVGELAGWLKDRGYEESLVNDRHKTPTSAVLYSALSFIHLRPPINVPVTFTPFYY